jgi:hypothetical protein
MVKASSDGNVAPENRLVDQVWGVLVCSGGCLMYGLFVERAIHPAAVLVATFLSMYPTAVLRNISFRTQNKG